MENTIVYAEGSESHEVASKTLYNYQPHVDLTNVLEMYKPMLALVFHYENPDIIEKIEITGLSFNGTKDKRGLVISGTILSLNNRAMALNSESIKYSSTKYGFEDSLEEMEEKIVDEVYQFIFEGKKGQLSMFSDAEMSGEDIQDAEEIEENEEENDDLESESESETDLEETEE